MGAAHCMFTDQDATQAVSASDITVRLGEHDLSSTADTTILKDVQVKSIMNHESYAPATGSLNNDITVLELMEEVDLDTYTPACLAKSSDATTFDGKNAWVYGEIKLLSSCSSGNNHLTKVGGQHPMEDIHLTY